MPISDLVCLAILPVPVWLSYAFFARSRAKSTLMRHRTAGGEPQYNPQAEAQSWTIYGLVSFALVLIALAVWIRNRGLNLVQSVLNPSHWEYALFHGIIFGLSLGGLLLIFARIFPEVGKVRLLSIAGIGSPASIRAAGLLFVVFTEEFWRAVCLKVLISDGVSGTQAWIVTSIVYGVAFMLWGIRVAVSEGIIGTIFGALFLWSGSFFVSFAAHFTLEGHILLYGAAGAPAEADDTHRRGYARCPLCGKNLNIQQVKLDPGAAFLCPFCHTRITVSDRRRWLSRWALILVELAFVVGFWEILPQGLSSSVGEFWISMMLAFCAAIGLWSIIQVAIPPTLERGDSYAVRLKIEDQKQKVPSKENTSNPGESDSDQLQSSN